ncbi:MAG: hypothetical protein R3F61_17335 [Myxococcota bacterium]
MSEFLEMLSEPVEGLVNHDGVQTGGQWSLTFTEVKADTARLGEQCPDLSLEARGTLVLETTGPSLVGTGAFVLDSWTVDGWVAELFSQSAELDAFAGTLRLELGGDDFDEVRFSQGFFGGNDGQQSTELGFSTR